MITGILENCEKRGAEIPHSRISRLAREEQGACQKGPRLIDPRAASAEMRQYETVGLAPLGAPLDNGPRGPYYRRDRS